MRQPAGGQAGATPAAFLGSGREVVCQYLRWRRLFAPGKVS